MHKNLLIVESPSKARTIEKYLGKDWRVLATYGHIRDLPSKDGSVDPEKSFLMHYKLIDKSKKNVSAILDFISANESEVNLYLGTDPDREGEAIAWHVSECLRESKKIKFNSLNIKRPTFNAITKDSVVKALAECRDLDMSLIKAQQSRLALDYLVGFTLSPILWRTVGGLKSSAGRVQSVALRLITDREREILDFKSEEYWSIHGSFYAKEIKDQLDGNLILFSGKKVEKFSFKNKAEVDAVLLVAQSRKDYLINSIEKKNQQKNPYPPFTTSSLQQAAFNILNFNAKKTMSVAQKLYEGVSIRGENTGLITYMRTDGVYITDKALNEIRDLISSKFGEKYLHKEKRVYSNKIKNAQEAHEAIRPTIFDQKFSPDNIKGFLSDEEYRLYDLIWKRTLASQMSSAMYNIVNIIIGSGSGNQEIQFKSIFSTLIFDGFLALYQDREDDESHAAKAFDVSSLVPGQTSVALKSINGKQHFTEPPARYTEASLIKKMEEVGIGRPSTYASIISILQTREYVQMRQKKFHPTVKGHVITSFLVGFFSKYVAYNFTAAMENELDSIASGELDYLDVLNRFWNGFKQNIEDVKATEIAKIMDQVSKSTENLWFSKNSDDQFENNCPTCLENDRDGKLFLKFSKFGYFLGCSNYPVCQFVKALSDIGSNDEKINAVTDYIYDKNGMKVALKKGKFGNYIEIDSGLDTKRVGIPADLLSRLNDEIIEKLARLPILIGLDNQNHEIKLNLGPYGFYLSYKNKFISIGKSFGDPFELDLENCFKIIDAYEKKIERNTKFIKSEKYGDLRILKGGFGKMYLIVDDKDGKEEKVLLPKDLITFNEPDAAVVENFLSSRKKKRKASK